MYNVQPFKMSVDSSMWWSYYIYLIEWGEKDYYPIIIPTHDTTHFQLKG